ncbi:single-stranded DNA-binding protein [Castellaniella sp.]|uniref:single-stranded DNA-binding protein n=1 Tax=Castellaniella sp. TaxID=1955812 RepID=UPI002B0006FA|nr:single-stranded DNA-binding protein [Castellaniella sp.]
MAGSVNKVILVGNCTRDPEVKSFNNGGRVCNITVATSESWKDKNSGEWKERAEFHRVVVFNETMIGRAERSLRKGSKVYVEGQLETRKYERDGREQFTTEVVLRPYRGELTLLDGKQDGEGGSQGGDYSGSYGSSRQSAAPAGLDDEIPF